MFVLIRCLNFTFKSKSTVERPFNNQVVKQFTNLLETLCCFFLFFSLSLSSSSRGDVFTFAFASFQGSCGSIDIRQLDERRREEKKQNVHLANIIAASK